MVCTTPFEALHGNNSNVSHLRVFGSKAWARIPLEKMKAFQDKSSKCILLIYAEDGKEYKLMEVANRKCFFEWIFQFEEDRLCDTPPSEEKEGITTLPLPFDDDAFLYDFDSDEEDRV